MWRTVRTEHYRVHYPAVAEPWSLSMAAQLEEIRARVAIEVGWAPDRVVDVIVRDPVSSANGSAWPFVGGPRLDLWVTPSGSGATSDDYRTWSESLMVHEDAHLVHLLRDSRNPLFRSIQPLLTVAPTTLKAPRWVIEGYATVVEGRLTGLGRPHSDLRAVLLRELAADGRLPTYGELNGTERYRGGSFAYLVGSAYLEWLEARQEPGSLRRLWARLTARVNRSFDDSFTGVYGASPSELYARFCAELTHDALELQRLRGPERGELWVHLPGHTGRPAVDADGARIAATRFEGDKPPALVVWAAAPDAKALERAEERLAKVLEADPEDVAPVPPPHPPREQLGKRRSLARPALEARWLPGDGGLLLTVSTRDRTGRARPDLWVWDPDGGGTRRITRGADVRSADPAPDGTWAVAVRHAWGQSQLVRVDLDTGALEPLSSFAPDVVFDHPRLSPDGRRLAWQELRGHGWMAVIEDLEDGTRWTLGPDPAVRVSDLAWTRDGTALLAIRGAAGELEVATVWSAEGARGVHTSTGGRALSVEPLGDRALVRRADAAGVDLLSVELEPPGPAPEPADHAFITRGRAPTVPELTPAPLQPPRRYGLGRTEGRALLGGAFRPDAAHGSVGARFGDIVGRRDLLLQASWGGERAVTGGRAAVAVRALPVEIVASGFAASEGELERGGGALEARHRVAGSIVAGGGAVGGFADVPLADGEGLARVAGHGRLWAGVREGSRGALRGGVRASGRVSAYDGATSMGGQGTASLGLGRRSGPRVRYGMGVTTATDPLDQFALGGLATAIWPDGVDAFVAREGAFVPGVATGAIHQRAELAWSGPVELFAVQHRMGPSFDRIDSWTSVGLEVSDAFDAQPFVRLPAGAASLGLACGVQDPLLGWVRDPCTAVSEYTVWGSLSWTL